MYSACMFCKRPLGTNEVVEDFPVGRALAFDSAKGRLWVLCGRCKRWNLTPLEERWEAIETCERLFESLQTRASTENIGLARHPEGLELVRIGRPLRPEFAAWRYGDRFGARRRRRILTAAGACVAAGGAIALGGVVAGTTGITAVAMSAKVWWENRPVVRFRTSDGRTMRLNRWCGFLTVVRPASDELGLRVQTPRGWNPWSMHMREDFTGDGARQALESILPWVNSAGAAQKTVRTAVDEIEASGHPSGLLRELPRRRHAGPVPDGFTLRGISKPTRLALEMALHEEHERRALEGELWTLERAWREAEEIAAIADNLLVSRSAIDPEASEPRP